MLITFNTVFIINKYNHSIDVVLQRQALSVGRSISTLMKGDLPWEYFIQLKLEALLESNAEILELSVLRPEGDDFKIVASSNKERIENILSSYFYKLAWLEPKNDGLATDSMHLEESGENIEFINDNQNRFWLVAMPMRDTNNEKQALLTVKLSSQIVDKLTRYNRNASIYLLVGTVFVVMLFLLVVVRLWDYALLYKKVKEVDKIKDEFVSMATHELRTPITGISGFLSMVISGEMGPVNNKIKEALTMASSASERLAILVDDLLDVGRIEQGRVSLSPKPTEPARIIKETMAELRVQAKNKKLAFNFQPHKEVLPIISIDKDRFKQVLINLIGNAIKYTPSGEVLVLTHGRYGGRVLEIKIKDTG
ncbi:MAG: HAMP domain-containing histidine kinase, partial [Elusimicrobiales bacterium]|nr:HAMP domain-containing histidine kinase [Elusimicrobiales bacterium]